MTWQAFVDAHGWQVRAHYLAAAVGQPVEAIDGRRRLVSPARRPKAKSFVELFTMFHGRPPRDVDWPPPRKVGSNRQYEWQGPELALIASLVGTMDVSAIAHALTERLRRVTGDPSAERGRVATQIAINRIGLSSNDVTGGISVREAAGRAGSLALVQQAIHLKRLRTFRVGRLHVIPRDVFEVWLAARDQPPEGWVRLASIRKALGIKSDKLPEYARLGYIPDAVFVRSSHLWFISPELARELVDDAHQGRPLPWHGQPQPGNLIAAWNKWQKRRHRRCATCRDAWGPKGAPRSFADWCARYPDLDLGVKRHLTVRNRRWKPLRPWGSCRAFRARGVTIPEAARQLERPIAWVRAAIRDGSIRPLRDPRDAGAPLRISPASMARLRSLPQLERRGRPEGTWLGLHAAARHAGICITTLVRWGQQRLVQTKWGPRGRLYSLTTLERHARLYWATVRFHRAVPPAWLAADERQSA